MDAPRQLTQEKKKGKHLMRRADILARHLWQQNQAKKKVINTEGKRTWVLKKEKEKEKKRTWGVLTSSRDPWRLRPWLSRWLSWFTDPPLPYANVSVFFLFSLFFLLLPYAKVEVFVFTESVLLLGQQYLFFFLPDSKWLCRQRNRTCTVV